MMAKLYFLPLFSMFYLVLYLENLKLNECYHGEFVCDGLLTIAFFDFHEQYVCQPFLFV